eukprot:1551587-Rhodomonas_salina.1
MTKTAALDPGFSQRNDANAHLPPVVKPRVPGVDVRVCHGFAHPLLRVLLLVQLAAHPTAGRAGVRRERGRNGGAREEA